jgi:NADH dehydrogenase
LHSEIVIVGGGAGGLELACKLGRKLGPDKVMLVDSRLYHVWKPSLHEVAAGTLDIHQEGLSYQMLAHDRGFTFVYGAMTALDGASRTLTIGPVSAASDGEEIFPERTIGYRALVMAVGSTSNYFGVPGARENTISLNATEDAERFRLRLLRLLAQAAEDKSGGAGRAANQGAAVAKAVSAGSFDSGVVPTDRIAQHGGAGAGGSFDAGLDAATLAPGRHADGLDIVIIGGGATGVELAAELREASGAYAVYGFSRLQVQRDVRITLLEGARSRSSPIAASPASTSTRSSTATATAMPPTCACGRPASVRPSSCPRSACRPTRAARSRSTATCGCRAWRACMRSATVPPASTATAIRSRRALRPRTSRPSTC